MLADSTSVQVGGKDDRGREPASVSQEVNDQNHGLMESRERKIISAEGRKQVISV